MVTILGIGLFIHWLIPAITVAAVRPRGYSVAYRSGGGIGNDRQLAASLKDGAYSRRESLLNDASGLVAFNFAIAAVLTGSFSPGDAVVKFFLMAFGASSVASWCGSPANVITFWFGAPARPAIQILISLLIPFAAYLLAEAFHVSGILAAVAAGIAMHYEQLSGPRLPATRMKSSAVWSMLQTTLNGMIFLMLGEQLPRMLRTLPAVASRRRLFARICCCTPWPSPALGLMRFAGYGCR